MISSEKISELIKNPQLVERADVEAISAIREKFSYCSTLHLLYLKGRALTNDIHFEDHLRYAAAHVMDRERMYYLVHSEGKIANSDEKVSQQNSKQSTLTEAAVVKKIQSETEINKIKAISIEPKIEPNVDLEISIKKINSESVQLTKEKSIEEKIVLEKNELTPEKSDELIESTILPTLAEVVFEKELNSTAEINKIEIVKLTEDNKKDEINKSEPVKNVHSNSEKIISVESEIDLSKLSFVEWLKYKQGQPIKNKEKEETDIAEIKIVQATNSTEKTANVSEVKKEAEPITESDQKKSLSKSHVDAILNKFINEEPSISRPKGEFFSPTKTAKQSLEESPDLVTETLAKIYVLQKNYSKAIKAYERLILVYPEKKLFFASQIQKIKDEQH